MTEVDLFAEIVPGKSAAGFELGMNIDQFKDVTTKAKRWVRSDGQLGAAVRSEPGWLFVDVRQLSETQKEYGSCGIYHYGSGAVELKFDSHGFLEWVAVGDGYKGKFKGTIGVDDKLKKVADIFDLIYDNVEELHFPVDDSGVSGIMFQAEEISLELSPDQEIYRIIIYNQS